VVHVIIETLLERCDCHLVESPLLITLKLELKQNVNELGGASDGEGHLSSTVHNRLLNEVRELDVGFAA
jgi:hypothetical protein